MTIDARVSVAMATYNGERFLQEQLDSLARQTLLPYELVVCDDGSTDGTLDILHRFAAEAPFPVRIYRNKERLGHGRNFLQAASMCCGELIAFCDQDDVWLESKLQRCVEVISETGSVLLVHSAEVVDENLRPLRKCTFSSRRPVFLDSELRKGWRSLAAKLGMSPGFACVFRSALVSQIPPVPPLTDSIKNHEHWLLFAGEVVGKIALIPDALVLYRQHGRNTIGFHARRYPTWRECLSVGTSEYAAQAEEAAIRAKFIGNVEERLPELRPRLTKARRWYEMRARSLARRASLYSHASRVPGAARSLISMVLSGTYRRRTLGGLGLWSLAKDSVSLFRPPRQRALDAGNRA